MSKVLVTGGAGFIGSHTVDLLLEKGYEVRVLDSLQPRVHPRGKPDYLPPEVEFMQGDVADREDLNRALKGVGRVFHLAAYQDYLPDFSTFIHTNTESTALLFELIVANKYPVEKIVFASSQSVSGEGRYECVEHGEVKPAPRPLEQLTRGDWEIKCPRCGSDLKPLLIDEGTVRPGTTYAISKYAIELLAETLGRRYGVPTACMRYTYVQGSRNSFYNAYSGIARRFALRLLHGLPPLCYEDGMQLRDYVNVRDVARANVIAMEDSRADFGVFNTGGGRAVTVLEFARIMIAEFGSDLEPLVPGEFRLGDTRHTISDNLRMNALGWEPTVPVEQNVREYVAWMREQKDTAEYLEEAERVMREQGVVRSVAGAPAAA
ncbi:MAG: NAD-dependent epimerase/dehydratase family protein [Acidobacteriota bacterium]|nr:NAD-dependent epimerase/dehydratase family protein [Acidobacteriota bacterium]